jgi:hypothetical protein
MVEKPTFQGFLDDLVRCTENPSIRCRAHKRTTGRQIMIKCKEGTAVLRASVQPSNIV